jgi:hypothetical protein
MKLTTHLHSVSRLRCTKLYPTPPYDFMAWCLIKHGGNFTFTLLFVPTGWMIGVLGFDSRRRLGIFLFTAASRPALGLTQLPIQWVPGALSLGVKRPGRKADHSPPSSAEVKEWVELYLYSPNTPSWSCAQLKEKHGDNFTFTLCSSLGVRDE